MSGGSYDYIYHKLRVECAQRMYDDEMNELIIDLADVLHDLEWWESGDYCEESYRNTLRAFKAKWFQGDREQRLKYYVDANLEKCRKELYDLIGVKKGGKENGERETGEQLQGNSVKRWDI